MLENIGLDVVGILRVLAKDLGQRPVLPVPEPIGHHHGSLEGHASVPAGGSQPQDLVAKTILCTSEKSRCERTERLIVSRIDNVFGI